MTEQQAPLYFRRVDGAPSEPLSAGSFNALSKILNGIIIDLETLPITDPKDADSWLPRTAIRDAVSAHARELSRVCDFLRQVQDAPTPLTCPRCNGFGREERFQGARFDWHKCSRCGGVGLVESDQRYVD